LVFEKMFENVKERLVVDEIGRVIAVKLLQIAEDLGFDITD